MSSDHIITRKKIQSIADIETFNGLLDACMLSDEDKQLLRMHYIKGQDFRYIGDMLGFAESTVKRKHRKALQKLNKML